MKDNNINTSNNPFQNLVQIGKTTFVDVTQIRSIELNEYDEDEYLISYHDGGDITISKKDFAKYIRPYVEKSNE